MEFVAFDVETANRRRDSICAVGYAVVRKGLVSESGTWLANPGPVEFDPWNTRIHGIRREDVNQAPPLPDVIARLVALIGEGVAVVHNAAFDIGAIRDSTISTGVPVFDYVDTLLMARRQLTLISYKLPVVAEALNVPLARHHDAADDAKATAGIALAFGEMHRSDSITALAQSMKVTVGRLAPIGKDHISRSVWSESKHPGGVPEPNLAADSSHPLYGKVIVFSGALTVPRQQAWEWAANVGAVPEANVTKRTNILVIGDGFIGESLADFGTGKAKKAMALLDKGHKIEVMDEWEYIQALNG